LAYSVAICRARFGDIQPQCRVGVAKVEMSAGASMQSLKRTAPIVVSLAIILAVTTVLFYFKSAQQQHHLVFFYLFPTALVAMIYGSVLSMLCAIIATLVAAFFLYDPTYSLYVSDPREVGELIVFAGTGLIGAKCIAELMRSPEKPPLSFK
jgi:K+-sensing histidine kinase KdpD